MPAGYFDRTPTIHSHEQMMDRLKSHGVGKGTLSWNKPVRQENDSGYQTSVCGRYVVRKASNPKGMLYYAWRDAPRRLLGYSADIELAKAHCDAHALGAGT
jgi:hypothetical protein